MKRNKVKADLIIFDLDGTLVDTGRDIAAAVNYVRGSAGLPAMTLQQILVHVGNGLRVTLRGCFADAGKKINVEELIDSFIGYYGRHLLDNSALYPRVKAVLDHYSGKKKVVVSNKTEDFCKYILEGLGVGGYFQYVWGCDSFPKIKPDPEPIFQAIRRTGTAGEAIMIGDGENDILSANAAGIRSCAVTYGFSAKETLSTLNPTFIIDRLDELFDIVE